MKLIFRKFFPKYLLDLTVTSCRVLLSREAHCFGDLINVINNSRGNSRRMVVSDFLEQS